MHVTTGGIGRRLLAAALMASAAGAQQINVNLTLAHSLYVLGEPVLAQIDVSNTTRDPIALGEANAPEKFMIEISRGGWMNELQAFRDDPLVPAMTIAPGRSMTHRLDLDKWFPLLREGKYIVRAVVISRGMRYVSSPRSFDIAPGLRVLEGSQMFADSATAGQRRTFLLVHLHRNQEDRLFLRVADEPDGRVWDTLDLGVWLRHAGQPKFDISPEGEVTVVHRATQDAFLRTLIWSLPESVDVEERQTLLDPEISASRRMREMYGEMSDAPADEKRPWWRFW